MTTEPEDAIPPELQARLIRRWACNDDAAADFIAVLFEASHLADDIVDGDSADPCRDMAQVWMLFFGRIMPNPFYQAHVQAFAGAIVPAVADWQLSTAWQGDPDPVKRLYAYVLRETLEHAVVLTAFLMGGAAHAALARRELSEIFHIQAGREPLEQWFAEHEQEYGRRA